MKRKTVSEKKLEGTNRKDREVKHEVQYLEELPKLERWFTGVMSTRAKKLYKHFAGMLIKTGRLSEMDLPNIVQLAQAWDKWLWAEEAMNNLNSEKMGSGFKQVFKSGASNITTEFSIAKEAQNQILTISKLFGLSMKDRYGMLAFFEKEDPNQLDLFEQMRAMNPSNGLKAVN